MKLLTINVGDLEYAKYSTPFIKKLCDYNNIDFFCIDKDPHQNKYGSHPSWIKLFAHDLYDDDFIICWDLDLVPRRLYDLKKYFNVDQMNFSHDTAHLKEGFTFNGKFKYNCGLMGIPKSFSKELKNIYLNNGMKSDYPSYEQYHVNDWIFDNNIAINLIPEKLNRMARFYDNDVLPEDTLNIHYSHNNRSELIKKHYEEYGALLSD
jgi:hypothetical protein